MIKLIKRLWHYILDFIGWYDPPVYKITLESDDDDMER